MAVSRVQEWRFLIMLLLRLARIISLLAGLEVVRMAKLRLVGLMEPPRRLLAVVVRHIEVSGKAQDPGNGRSAAS